MHFDEQSSIRSFGLKFIYSKFQWHKTNVLISTVAKHYQAIITIQNGLTSRMCSAHTCNKNIDMIENVWKCVRMANFSRCAANERKKRTLRELTTLI